MLYALCYVALIIMKYLIKFILRALFVVGFVTLLPAAIYYMATGEDYLDLHEDINRL